MTEKCLELKNIRKGFSDEEEVLKGISLAIEKGEFITLLGSSGCGKTTTLRIIAGLEMPDAGQVFLDGKDVTALNPEDRDVNTVFQNYALFPHMNVADNIGYGLRLKKVPRTEIRRRVKEMLELVQLPGYEKRKPSELGITFIYITHDQEEAINMSDRIAVMNHGTFEQIGIPDEIYNHPRTSYVATFVGNANILKGVAGATENGKVAVNISGGHIQADSHNEIIRPGEKVTLAVRSENIRIDEECSCGLSAVVTEKTFAGGLLRVVLKLTDGTELVASRYGIDARVQQGQTVSVCFAPEDAVLVDRDAVREGGEA